MRLLSAAALAALAAAPAAAQTADCAADLAELQRTVRSALLAESPADSAGYVVVDVDPATSQGRVVFAAVNASEGARADAIRRVGAHLERWPASAPLFFRLAPRAGEEGATCAAAPSPSLANTGALARELQKVGREYRARTDLPLAATAVRVGVLVTAEGRNGLVLMKSRTGDSWLDERLHAVAAQLRFRPATVNGRPVDAWTDLTIPVVSGGLGARIQINDSRRQDIPGNPRRSP